MSEVEKHSVLIIDNDQDYLEIIKLGLGWEFDILTVGNIHTLKTEIQGMQPSLIMLNTSLGEARLKVVVDFVKGISTLKSIPIYLTSVIDTEEYLAYELGLDGFMLKPGSFGEIRNQLYLILKGLSN